MATNKNSQRTEGALSATGRTHASGTRRGDAGLICAIHDPGKLLAGSEDLGDEHEMGGTCVKQGQVEKLDSRLEEEAEAPGRS